MRINLLLVPRAVWVGGAQLKNKLSDSQVRNLSKCNGAFVVFNNEESYMRCISQYKKSKSWCVAGAVAVLPASPSSTYSRPGHPRWST